MSNGTNLQVVTYSDLLREKARLEALIENQKNIVRHDLDELKTEFKKEIKPAMDAASFIKKVALPEKRKKTMLHVGAGVAIDLIIGSIFPKSNFLLRLFIPKLLKKYTTYYLSTLSGLSSTKKIQSKKVSYSNE